MLLPLDIYARGVCRLICNYMFVIVCYYSLAVSCQQNSLYSLLLTEETQTFSLDEGTFQLDKISGIQIYVGYSHL